MNDERRKQNLNLWGKKMVNKCIVTGCRPGYNESQKSKAKQENSDHGVKVQLHKYPDDKAREALWKSKIPGRHE